MVTSFTQVQLMTPKDRKKSIHRRTVMYIDIQLVMAYDISILPRIGYSSCLDIQHCLSKWNQALFPQNSSHLLLEEELGNNSTYILR